VPFEPGDRVTREPADPAGFAREIAERVNRLIADPDLATRMGEAGRTRAVEQFSWQRIAEETLELYRSLAS
jgi:starch synthase